MKPGQLKNSFYFLLVIAIFTFTPEFFAQSDSSIEVKIINTNDLKSIFEEAKGNALFINVWATWCEPCREEFPEIVKLADNYKNEIHFIGISVDDAGDLSGKVIPFLESQNASFKNYLLKVKEPEDFINMLDKDWSGAVPATFIYDKSGIQKAVLIGKQSYSQFESAIKKVIN